MRAEIITRLKDYALIKKVHLSIMLISLVILIAYGNSLSNGFAWDDISQILNNSSIQTYKAVFLFFTDYWKAINLPEMSYSYRPMLGISFILDYQIWGLNPFGYHLTNLMLHIAIALLVYFFALKTINDNSAALVSGLVFALHPANIEAINFISARTYLLCAAFLLAAFLFYLKESKKYEILSYVSFVAALLSNEIAFIFPILIFFYNNFYKMKNRRYLLFSAIIGFVYWLLKTSLNLISIIPFTKNQSQIIFAPQIILEYFATALLPFKLKLLYDPLESSVVISSLSLSLVILIGLFAFTFITRKKINYFGLTWFFISLIPVSGIVHFSPIMMAERYMYIPIIGLALFFGSLYVKLKYKKAVTVSLLVLFIIFNSIIINRNINWKNNTSLFKRAIKDSPNSALAHYYLGNTETDLGNFGKAKRSYQKSIRLNPYYPHSWVNLANLFDKTGELELANKSYKKALDLMPNNVDVLFNLALVEFKMKKYNDSKIYLKRLLKINPNDEEAQNNLLYLQKLTR